MWGRWISCLLFLTVLVSGCNSTHKTPVNSGTAATVNSMVNDINVSIKNMETKQTEYFKTSADRDGHNTTVKQFLADRIEVARYANFNNPQPNAVTSLVESNLSPAAVAVGVLPSVAAKDKEIEDLRLALSNSAGDKKVLETRNQALTDQANLMKGETIILDQQVHEKQDAILTAVHTVDEKTNQINQANNTIKISAAETDSAIKNEQKTAAAKARLETARWFMLAGGVVMALGILGLFLHILDAWIALATGGSLLVVGWLITYVEDLLQQPWFRYLLDGLVVAAIIAVVWFIIRAFNHHKATVNTSTGFQNLVGAVQDAANKDPALVAELQPYLQQWHITPKGTADHGVMDAINQVAVKLNLINPGQVSAATGVETVVSASTPAGAVSVVAVPAPAVSPTN